MTHIVCKFCGCIVITTQERKALTGEEDQREFEGCGIVVIVRTHNGPFPELPSFPRPELIGHLTNTEKR